VDEFKPGVDISGYAVQSEMHEPLGRILDYVLDELGQMRYLVVETGLWIFGKNVLIPVGLTSVDDLHRRVILWQITPELLEILPAFEEIEDLDTDYEADLLSYFGVFPPNPTAGVDEFDSPIPTLGNSLFETPARLRKLEPPSETETFSS
jgi:hypothetical protein